MCKSLYLVKYLPATRNAILTAHHFDSKICKKLSLGAPPSLIPPLPSRSLLPKKKKTLETNGPDVIIV